MKKDKDRQTEGISLQAAGCETTPEPAQHTEGKIIPFPGVELNHELNYQSALDGFLREIGYIE
jgi:hypothetical protein